MFAHRALRLRLINDAAVSTLIGTRIFAGVLKQGVTYPAVAYRQIGADSIERLEERGHSGLAQYRYRFFSTTTLANGGYDTAKDVAEAIRLCIQGFSGVITDSSVSPIETLNIQGVFHRFTLDGYDDSTQTYQVISDYEVWAAEVQPI